MPRTVEAHEPKSPDASQGTRGATTASPAGPVHGDPGGLARLPAAQRAAAVLPTWALADQVENMQLLEHGQDRAAGPELRARIYEKLFAIDADPRWATRRMGFATVVPEGSQKMEGWMYDEVRTFEHMKRRP